MVCNQGDAAPWCMYCMGSEIVKDYHVVKFDDVDCGSH